MWWLMFVAILCVQHTAGLRYIEVTNKNNFPIWIETLTNNQGPPLRPGVTLLEPRHSTKYDIQDSGWAGRLWPKTGCDDGGANCEIGQSMPPCPPNGCHPPAETKVEFFFPATNSNQDSLMISVCEITPHEDGRPYNGGPCTPTNCHLLLSQCPRNERNSLGDLSVKGRRNNDVACMSTCKRWNYPPPYGQGKNEQEGDRRLLCCPAGVSVEECFF
ncbi:uncharacterized protein LOC129571643 [Sitodiplosis mosellana]|uniref:uncharacterized protein LOC129571643 n=1 Tax=Sitodiplosis mosellana TaxID=263140 RepID=UPI0024448615|nr:uncharacterized protein LOC129571643 [Sitodiplosis mosellana]